MGLLPTLRAGRREHCKVSRKYHEPNQPAGPLTPGAAGNAALRLVPPHKFSAFTPYTRFSYVNALVSDQAWPFVNASGLHYGPGIGLRWDFCTLAALKLQYDYIHTAFSPNTAIDKTGQTPFNPKSEVEMHGTNGHAEGARRLRRFGARMIWGERMSRVVAR